jgi:hypothetical protein
MRFIETLIYCVSRQAESDHDVPARNMALSRRP